MTSTRNSSVILSSRPDGLPIPGEHLVVTNDATIDLDSVALHGGLLVKTIALSVDPYYRLKMNTAYKLGEPITGHIVGRVIRSELEGYSSGDYIYTEEAPFQEYALVLPGASQLRRVEKNAATWVQYIGVLGLVTRTAWLGFHALAKAKKVGIYRPIEHALERKLIQPNRVRQSSCRPQLAEWEGKSSAALPPKKRPFLLTECVSVVAQIAKQQGLKVIGSAGSDEKVKYLKEELGVDAAFNYKTEDPKDVLKREGPIDIYWDHVGGKTLEAVIDNMNVLGRVIVCGFIEQYNSKDNTGFGVKNLSLVCARQLSITGFFVGSLEKREGDFGFFKEAPKLVRDGKIKIREEVRQGLDSVPQFLLDIQQGKNLGKAVVIVADE